MFILKSFYFNFNNPLVQLAFFPILIDIEFNFRDSQLNSTNVRVDVTIVSRLQ